MTERVVLECTGVSHAFGEKPVLHDVNLKILRGEIVALVGPSGCGKSTFLRAILGTHLSQQGVIRVNPESGGASVVVRKPGRDRGIVYQRYALFPFLTALDNVAIGLALDRTSIPFRILAYPWFRKKMRQYREEAHALLTRLGLGDAAGKYPRELSGGMCQRVAVAQALIMKPEILLLDEPFGALDEATREIPQQMLLELYAENRAALARKENPPYTILIVTHELKEAMKVGDRVIGLSQYWDWKSAGHTTCPGATIVYDQAVPVYLPDDPVNMEDYKRQQKEIRAVVFDPAANKARGEFLKFWEQIARGEGKEVVTNGRNG